MTRLSLVASFVLLSLTSTSFAAQAPHQPQPDLQRFQIRHRSPKSLAKKQLTVAGITISSDGITVGNSSSNSTSTDDDSTGKAGILDLFPGLGGDDSTSSAVTSATPSTSSTASSTETASTAQSTQSSSSVVESSSSAVSSSSSSSSSSSTSTSSKASSTSSSVSSTLSTDSTSATASPTDAATLGQQNSSTDDDDSKGLSKTVITLIVIGSSVVGAFVIWTLVRKWRLGTSKRFQERMRPISFGPNDDEAPTFGAVIAKRNEGGWGEKNGGGPNGGWNQIGDGPESVNGHGHQRDGSNESMGTGYGALRGPGQLARQDSWGNRSGYGGGNDRPVFERALTPQPQAPPMGYAAPQFPPHMNQGMMGMGAPIGAPPAHMAYNMPPPPQAMPPPMNGNDPYAQDAQGLPYPDFSRGNSRTPQPGFDPYYNNNNRGY